MRRDSYSDFYNGHLVQTLTWARCFPSALDTLTFDAAQADFVAVDDQIQRQVNLHGGVFALLHGKRFCKSEEKEDCEFNSHLVTF